MKAKSREASKMEGAEHLEAAPNAAELGNRQYAALMRDKGRLSGTRR